MTYLLRVTASDRSRPEIFCWVFGRAFAMGSGTALLVLTANYAALVATPSAQAAVTSLAAASPNSLPGPHQPQCNESNDGLVWVSGNGVYWICSYVDGLGWQWVPLVQGCGAAVGPSLYARLPAAC